MRRMAGATVIALVLFGATTAAGQAQPTTTTTPTTTVAAGAEGASVTVSSEAEYRAALAAFNATPSPPHVIEVSADFTITGATEPAYTANDDLEVRGNGHTISGGSTRQILDSTSTGTLTIDDLSLVDGLAPGPTGHGGAIRIGGSIVLRNTSFTGNEASFGGAIGFDPLVDAAPFPPHVIEHSTFIANTAADTGGALDLRGDLTLRDTTFVDNRAGKGGAVAVQNGGLLVEDSSFGSNRAELVTPATIVNNGGAIWTQVVDTEIRRSTFEDNHADGGLGGGVFSLGDLVLDSSTLVRNSAVDGGAVAAGGIRRVGAPGRVDVRNSTFVANAASRDAGAVYIFNFDAMPASVTHVTFVDNRAANGDGAQLEAYNPEFPVVIGATVFSRPGGGLPNCLFQDGGTTTSATNHASDDSCGPATSGDAELGAVADNGGPTLTVLPPSGSPLVDAITFEDCLLAVDQRGEARPQGAGCDIGATEISGGPVPIGPVPAAPGFTG